MNRNTREWKRKPLLERKTIEALHDAIAQMPCVVTGRTPSTVHHCHSGSLADIGINRGASQRPNDFLVIPLAFDFHVGNQGIDAGVGVRTWEQRYGTQVDHLKRVCKRLGVNLFELAGYDHVEVSL